ncbi:MAG: transcriptional regulator NrdR [Candidatus Ancillula sp.]|jgi:transcriptional repressor NrdR|nr:transcriptional regulator NrdR [Candidatus Ancillula sp.]
MRCPFCKNSTTKVVDSRISEDGFVVRRRRLCLTCNHRFSTMETTSLFVVKRSGVLEEFDKTKLLAGVRKSFQGRLVDEDVLAQLAQSVEDSIRARGVSQIDSYDVGLTLLEPLQKIDEVAYLRYASVYQGFETLDDFEKEIKNLRNNKKPDINKVHELPDDE